LGGGGDSPEEFGKKKKQKREIKILTKYKLHPQHPSDDFEC
jgi:hypothetical protein